MIPKLFLPLEQKSYVKYLGLLIDSNLSWKNHIGHITSKISKTVGIIARLRYYVPTSVLLTIYQCLIFPYLSHGIVAWGHAAQTYIIINIRGQIENRPLQNVRSAGRK